MIHDPFHPYPSSSCLAAMGSCLSKCYSGAGPALANAEADAVKEKHVVVSHAPPPIPLPNCQVNSNNVNVSVSSSSSCSSSDPSSPNSSASPSKSFSSLSANCSSCQHSPPSSSSKGLYLHQTALRSLPEKLCSSQATKQPLERGNNKLQVRAARVGERSSPASRSRTVVLRSAPQLERSKSLATGGDRFGRVQVAPAARKKLAGRPPIRPGKSTSRQGRLSHRKEEEEMHSMQRSLQMREIFGRRMWRDGFDVDQGQSCAVEDLNNPLISMDCFIFI